MATSTDTVPPKRHAEFYFPDGNVKLLVENILYNLHRSILERHSEVFLDVVGIRLVQGEDSKGGLGLGTVVVPSMKSADFECFLSILYPKIVAYMVRGSIPFCIIHRADLGIQRYRAAGGPRP